MKSCLIMSAVGAAITAAFLAATPVLAETTGSLTWSRTDTDTANLDAISGRLAWRKGYFGVEGELSGGIGSDTATVGGVGVKTRLDDQAAVYATGTVPVNDKAELFARVGVGTTRLSGQAFGSSASDTQTSLNYGVGGQWFFDGKNGVRADYTREDFRKDAAGNADVWSLGYTRRF